MQQLVVFTDLDGTLLDHATYAWHPALPALRLLRDRKIPVVFCSSKTRTEIEHYRRLLDNREPFVSENGGGIFIPEDYFDLSTLPPELVIVKEAGYASIHLGAPYHLLRHAIQELREEGFALTGFGDMTVAEVAELTGLTLDQAAMAKEREFDEPFVFSGSTGEIDKLGAGIRARGLCLTKGAFFHILGNSDKGIAVKILTALYRENYGEIAIIALGDSRNDLPMLQCADFPVAIRKPDGSHDPDLAMVQPVKTQKIGPEGWNEAIFQLQATLDELVKH